MEKKVVESKKRKSAEKKVSKENHELTSEIHKAILEGDKEWVQKLLDTGETLCSRREVNNRRGYPIRNCFTLALKYYCTLDFTKFLLSVDPDAGVTTRNSVGQTLLILCAKDHKVEEVKLLLELGADPEDLCDYGYTALMMALSEEFTPNFKGCIFLDTFLIKRKSYHEKCQYIVDLLIENGANVNIRNKNGETALHKAVKNQLTIHLEILQSLINAGADPTIVNREHCTVLSYAMKTFVELCKECRSIIFANEVYQALHYLFHLAPFQGDTFQLRCDVEMHPQVILLKQLSLCRSLSENQSILIDLLAGTTMFDPELVFMDCLQNVSQFSPYHSLECIKLQFGPLALYLNYEQYFLPISSSTGFTIFGRYLLENLQYLISVGLKCVTKKQTLSPLTVGLLHSYPHFNYVEAAKMMLNNGVHVEQRMLKFSVQDQELERMFLPHFAHPGLTLLPFTTPEKIPTLFPLLSSCGSLQNSALHTTKPYYD
ncbi:hypothetical protein B566_EDAN012105, partial [Ephemera danica]